MPRDGRKLARYRPFVTCDDPKGVVECGTIRKSKLSSYQTMEPRTDSQTRFKNPNRTLASITDEKDHGVDFLCAAKDLLKGSLDLQESLMILGKVQAASKYVSKVKKKKQEKGNNNGGQEGRDFRKQDEKIEELKEMNRSRFERQKGHFNQEPDIPSTSSSHSSSSNSERIDVKLEKSIARGPGIIAKLMGLEEISSKPMQKKPLLLNTDMQVAKLKEHICEEDSNGKKRKTLKEVLDTMRLKEMLKGDTDIMPPIVLIKPLQIPPSSSISIEKVEKVKASKRKPVRREVSNKKPGENEKVNKNDRRSVEKGIPQNHVSKMVKFDSRSNVVHAKKSHGSSKESRESGVIKEESQKQRKQMRASRTQTDQKRVRKNDQKMANELKQTKFAKEDRIKIDSSSEIDISIDINSIHIDEQPKEVIQDASKSRICEESTPGNRRSLLLSSPSFITRVEDLFSFISSSSPTTCEKSDSQPPNTRFYIDCATEVMERKSLHASKTHCSILHASMEKLVEEVCDGIEILNSYWSLQSDSAPVDGIYAVLKRDLNQNRGTVGSKLWDVGWNKVFSSDDFDKVVIELEEIIFSYLVAELFRGQM